MALAIRAIIFVSPPAYYAWKARPCLQQPRSAPAPFYEKEAGDQRKDPPRRVAPARPNSSEAELVAQFGFSRMTINRALRELTDEGLLVRLQGVGTFVAEPKGQSALLQCAALPMRLPPPSPAPL